MFFAHGSHNMGSGVSSLLPQQVFATSLYTGTGAAQTITNGLDLAGQGGLVWRKRRDTTGSHNLQDTVRGFAGTAPNTFGRVLKADLTNAEAADTSGGAPPYDITAYSANGFTIGPDWNGAGNTSAATYAAWSFRRAPKFFDVVTYTGNGVAGRQIAHNLGIAPGLIIVRDRTNGAAWQVYHKSLGNDGLLQLNATNANAGGNSQWGLTNPTATAFTLGSSSNVNGAGDQYVAYLFAHDPDTVNGIVQCGSYTETGSYPQTVSLGWQPQYILLKCSDAAFGWYVVDAARGLTSGTAPGLQPNSAGAEVNLSGSIYATSTGFTIGSAFFGTGHAVVYLAIRAPIFQGARTPQSVYSTALYQGTQATRTVVNGIDLAGKGGMTWIKGRTTTTYHNNLFDTVRGPSSLIMSDMGNSAYTVNDALTSFNSNGFTLGADASGFGVNSAGINFASWSFARAPKFFDIVSYTGNGTTQYINHNLSVQPGMIIVKRLDAAAAPVVWHYSWSGQYAYLNSTTIPTNDNTNFFGDNTSAVTPGDVSFSVGLSNAVNAAGGHYIAYLFANDSDTTNGIIKHGWVQTSSDGSASVTVGWQPQFVLVRFITTTSNWYMFDTVRGMASNASPVTDANDTNAEYGTGTGLCYATPTGFVTTTSFSTTSQQFGYMAIRAPTT